MKKIIFKPAYDTIHVGQIAPTEIVAYRSKSGSTICILKLLVKGTAINNWTSSWGFLPISGADDQARYVATTFNGALELAGKNRTLYTFESAKEFITELFNERII
jgi:hypothetical protein